MKRRISLLVCLLVILIVLVSCEKTEHIVEEFKSGCVIETDSTYTFTGKLLSQTITKNFPDVGVTIEHFQYKKIDNLGTVDVHTIEYPDGTIKEEKYSSSSQKLLYVKVTNNDGKSEENTYEYYEDKLSYHKQSNSDGYSLESRYFVNPTNKSLEGKIERQKEVFPDGTWIETTLDRLDGSETIKYSDGSYEYHPSRQREEELRTYVRLQQYNEEKKQIQRDVESIKNYLNYVDDIKRSHNL